MRYWVILRNRWLWHRRLHPWLGPPHVPAVFGAAVVALGVLGMWVVSSVVLAQSPWPTPPPGPPYPFPDGIEGVADVRSPELPDGGEVFVIRPQWPGFAPLVAPVESTTLTYGPSSAPPLSFRLERGTYIETVQVAVSSYQSLEEASSSGRPLLAGYSFALLDKDGAPYLSPARRPILVTVPVQQFVAQGVEPERLLFASLGGPHPVLLPTQYSRTDGVIETRLTEFHTIGIVHDRR